MSEIIPNFANADEEVDFLKGYLLDANSEIDLLRIKNKKLLDLIELAVKDLRMRSSEEGVINISGFIWDMLTEADKEGDE